MMSQKALLLVFSMQPYVGVHAFSVHSLRRGQALGAGSEAPAPAPGPAPIPPGFEGSEFGMAGPGFEAGFVSRSPIDWHALRFGETENIEPKRCPTGMWRVGCVIDTQTAHQRWYNDVVRKEDRVPMTPEVCYSFCSNVSGSQFFGLKRGDECYCTPFYHNTNKGGRGDCDLPCVGNPSVMCGGEEMADIYEMHDCNNLPAQKCTRPPLPVEHAVQFNSSYYRKVGSPCSNSQINALSTVNSLCSVECEPGFYLIKNDLKCEERGHRLTYAWAQMTGHAVCKPFNCGVPRKEQHATYAKGIVIFPLSVTYSCQQGYSIDHQPTGNKSFEVFCETTGFFGPDDTDCLPVTCGMCPQENNASADETGERFYRDNCNYYCETGYTADGLASGTPHFLRSCLPGGNFSMGAGCHAVSCGTPKFFLNSGLADVKAAMVDVVYPQKTRYDCEEGYTLSGKVGGLTEFSTTCQADGTLLKEDSCLPVTCGAPPKVDHADYRRTNLTYKQQTLYTCDRGYTFNGRANGPTEEMVGCLSDGMYNNTELECKPVECPDPPQEELTSINSTRTPIRFVNYESDAIMYVCDPGYSTSIDDSPFDRLFESYYLACMASGEYSQAPKCLNINDCKVRDCGAHGACVDVEKPTGTPLDDFTCECQAGYESVEEFDVETSRMEKKCKNINDCPAPVVDACGGVNVDGLRRGNCRDHLESYTCACGGGYKVTPKEDEPANSTCAPVVCGAVPEVNHSTHDHQGVEEEANYDTPNWNYTCEEGYTLNGSADGETTFWMRCMSSGGFTQAKACLPVSCGAPPPKLHADRDASVVDIVFPNTVTYMCDEGYSLDQDAAGPNDFEVECQADGTLSEAGEDCQKINCGVPPGLKNAEYTKGKKNELLYMESWKANCAEGHSLDQTPNVAMAQFTVTCQSDGSFLSLGSGGINSTDTALECLPIQCHTLPDAVLVEEPTVELPKIYQDEVTFTFHKGYTLDGEIGGDKTFTCQCQADGTFTPAKIPLPVKCGAAPSDTKSESGPGGNYSYTGSVTYSCSAGHSVDGEASSKEEDHEYDLFCDAEGEYKQQVWKTVHSTGSFGDNKAKEADFNKVFHGSTGILKRECGGCKSSHTTIYLKRKTGVAEWNAYKGVLVDWMGNVGFHTDFDLYSSLEDAQADRNTWAFCNGNDATGFPRDCGPEGFVPNQWSNGEGGGQEDIKMQILVQTDAAKPINCQPVKCGVVSPPANSVLADGAKSELIFQETSAFTCKKGYTLNGLLTGLTDFEVRCLANGSITEHPGCKDADDCGRKENSCSPNGKCVDKVDDFACECDSGFKPNEKDGRRYCGNVPDCPAGACAPGRCADLVNDYECHCTAGYYEGPNGELKHDCLPKSCGKPPAFDYSTVLPAADATKEFFFAGPVVQYTCDRGHTLDASTGGATTFSVACEDSGYFELPTDKCQPINCGAPPDVTNAIYAKSDVTFGETATYTCEVGYSTTSKTNGAKTFKATCQDDEQFTGVGACKPVECHFNAGSFDRNAAMSVNMTSPMLFGQTVNVTCNPGYSLNKDVHSQTEYEVSCGSDGRIVKPTAACEPIDCGDKPEVNFATVTGRTRYGQTLNATAIRGFTLDGSSTGATTAPFSCDADGNFTAPPAFQRISCGASPSMDHVQKVELIKAAHCPSGSRQVGAINADRPGCGMTSCSERYKLETAEECMEQCARTRGCRAFNWASLGGDKNHKDTTTCTMYHETNPTGTWGPDQVFCRMEAPSLLEMGAFHRWSLRAHPANATTKPRGLSRILAHKRSSRATRKNAQQRALERQRVRSKGTRARASVDAVFKDRVLYTCAEGYVADRGTQEVSPDQPKTIEKHCTFDGDFSRTTKKEEAILNGDNARCYADRYQDLKNAFGYRVNDLIGHWHRHGNQEGRTFNCANKFGTGECVPVTCKLAWVVKAEEPITEETLPLFRTYKQTQPYACQHGYSTDGTPSGPTTFQETCLANGTFSNDHDCKDIDYCLDSGCGEGTCVDGALHYTCDCNAGYEAVPGTGNHYETCDQIDECKTHGGYDACSGGNQGFGTCTDDTLKYTCKCNAGYENEDMGRGRDSCTPVTCAETPAVNNATTDAASKLIYQQTADYKCDTGFSVGGLVGGATTFTATCEADGQHTGVEACDPVACPDALAEYGNATTSATKLVFGDKAPYECKEGFKLGGLPSGARNFTVLCNADGEHEPEVDLTCLPVNCGMAPSIPSAVAVLQDVKFEQTVEYTCKEGHTLDGEVGGKTTFEVGCDEEDGSHFGMETCLPITCSYPDPIKNAVGSSQVHHYTQTYSVLCDSGYSLNANASGETSFVVTCGIDGKYSGVQECQAVSCGVPKSTTGAESTGPETFLDESATWTCKEGYSTSGRKHGLTEFRMACGANGEFSGPFHDCLDIDFCLGNPCGANGNCRDLGAGVVKPGYECTCLPGYEITKDADGNERCTEDDCHGSPCGAGGTCTDLSSSGVEGMYRCNCNVGYDVVSIQPNVVGDTCKRTKCPSLPAAMANVEEEEGRLSLELDTFVPGDKADIDAWFGTRVLHSMDEASFKCAKGYSTDGSTLSDAQSFKVSCASTGVLSSDLSTTGNSICQPIRCDSANLAQIANAGVTEGVLESFYEYGNEVSFSCSKGFTTTGKGDGASSFKLSCTADANFLPTEDAWEDGFCVTEAGRDQNSGVTKLASGDFATAEKRRECLGLCRAFGSHSACETISGSRTAGCYVHTAEVSRGNGRARYSCRINQEQCKPILCPVPSRANTVPSISGIVPFGTTVTYTCASGMKASGKTYYTGDCTDSGLVSFSPDADHWEKGFCVTQAGRDQNSGVYKLAAGDFQTAEKQQECVEKCRAYRKGYTACEVIWGQGNRGCYVHTKEIARGNGRDRHACRLPQVSCQPVGCGPIGTEPNARVIGLTPTSELNQASRAYTVKCDSGFRVGGSRSGPTSYTISCGADGQYKRSRDPDRCAPPPLMIKGEVTDAQSKAATLKNTNIVFKQNGVVVLTTTTDRRGRYSIQLPAGTYEVEGSLNGYITNTKQMTFTKNCNVGSVADMSLSKVLTGGQYRTVITWGEHTRDVDSWSYFGDAKKVGWKVPGRKAFDRDTGMTVILDRDDTRSYGPETTTFEDAEECTAGGECIIKFKVHNYVPSDGDLGDSAIVVKLYKGSSMLKSWSVPKSVGNKLWYPVFTLDPRVGQDKVYDGDMKLPPSMNKKKKGMDLDWGVAMDAEGWSRVPAGNLIYALTVAAPHAGLHDIHSAKYIQVDQSSSALECQEVDSPVCPAGFYLRGLYRTGMHTSHTGGEAHPERITKASCCKPKEMPAQWGTCVEEPAFKGPVTACGWSIPMKVGMTVTLNGPRYGKYCAYPVRRKMKCSSRTVIDTAKYEVADAGDGYIALKHIKSNAYCTFSRYSTSCSARAITSDAKLQVTDNEDGTVALYSVGASKYLRDYGYKVQAGETRMRADRTSFTWACEGNCPPSPTAMVGLIRGSGPNVGLGAFDKVKCCGFPTVALQPHEDDSNIQE